MLVRYTLNRDTLLIKSTIPHPAVNVSSKFVKLMKELCVRDNSTSVHHIILPSLLASILEKLKEVQHSSINPPAGCRLQHH